MTTAAGTVRPARRRRRSYSSAAHRPLEAVGGLLGLNLVWLVCCLPLVTAPAATAAMFGVVRHWRLDGPDCAFLRFYIESLRHGLRRASFIGIGWSIVGGYLVAAVSYSGGLPASLVFPARLLLGLLLLLLLAVTVWLGPLQADSDDAALPTVRNAALLALGQLPTTVACLVVLAAAGLLLVVAPVSILFVGSPTSCLLYWLCHRALAPMVSSASSSVRSTPRA